MMAASGPPAPGEPPAGPPDGGIVSPTGGPSGGRVRPPEADRPELVLASTSPRRAALLANLGIVPVVEPAHVDEAPAPGEGPGAFVQRLARDKARAGAAPGRLVIGADTTVALDGHLLGKPADADEAGVMLRTLSGRTHEVHTGVAVADGRRTVSRSDSTLVHVARLTDREIEWYLGTGEPLDKAGAYGIQGAGGFLVEGVDGDVQVVIGLSLRALAAVLADLGWALLDWSTSPVPPT
jgi:septum formation protein